MSTANDVPMPDRAKVEAALARNDDDRTTYDWNEIDEAARWALHQLPEGCEFTELTHRHPLSKVMFRAGLLAGREHMARFMEQTGHDFEIAALIRSIWWPALGEDPGTPRLLAFDEVAREEDEGYKSQPMTPSQEALPLALRFLDEFEPLMRQGLSEAD